MSTADGMPTNALYFILRLMLRILREETPQRMAFVLDGPGKNFRHELFPEYKAQRDATPEDLVRQLDPIKQAVQLLGIPLHVAEGCEADDCIASLAARYESKRPVIIIGADKEPQAVPYRQCLDVGPVRQKGKTDGTCRIPRGNRPWPLHPGPISRPLSAIPATIFPACPESAPRPPRKSWPTTPPWKKFSTICPPSSPSFAKNWKGNAKTPRPYRQLTRLDTQPLSGTGRRRVDSGQPRPERAARVF